MDRFTLLHNVADTEEVSGLGEQVDCGQERHMFEKKLMV